MEKNRLIVWVIMILLTLVASPVFASDWGSEDVTMQVGETKTLYLPSSITSKTLKSVTFYSASYNVVQVVSYSNYYVKVKALKATSTPVIVRCDYYYYINNSGYTYQNGGAYDFKVSVGGESSIKPTKISIPTVVSVEVGESKDIEVAVTPSNAEYSLTWSINDNSIATVTQNGMITGKSVGYADLKVMADNGVYAMCRVSVYKPKPSSVSIKSSLNMNIGDTYTLSPSVYPSDSEYTLTWSSDNSGVATVSQSGVVTARSSGTANITVKTNNGKTATCKVTVKAKSVSYISIQSDISLMVGDTCTLTPTITPADAVTSYTWSSDNSDVAIVSQSGVVIAKSSGTANITVKTDNGKTATCEVTVNEPELKEYEFSYSIYGYENGRVLFNADSVLLNRGSIQIVEGSNVALTIQPNEGYKIEWVWIDYRDVQDQLIDNVLTISNAEKDIYLIVSFVKDVVPVIIVPKYLYLNVGEGGYMTSYNSIFKGENRIGVGEGDDIIVKIVADDGYHINTVELDSVDAMSQLIDGELTVSNMIQDRSLVVRFEKDKDPDVQDEQVVSTEKNLFLGDVTAYVGTTVSFPISMTNVDEIITAFQLDLNLPSGFTLDIDESGNVKTEIGGRISNQHSLECSQLEDGCYRFICYSTKNSTFSGSAGELFSVSLNIGSNVEDGSYEIVATNIELSDKSGVAYSTQDVKGVVTVRSYMIGDTDNNGRHSINDAICIINYILNQPNSVFVEEAADIDGNGKITINDVVVLISKYILNSNSDASRAVNRSAMSDNGENYINIERLKMQPGEVKTIEVNMANDCDDIKGFQCDITLPQGVSFIFDNEIDEYVKASTRIPTKMNISSEKQSANTLRVAGVCTGTTAIYGNDGTVFSFNVKAEENILEGEYEILLSNIELSNGEAIIVPDYTSVLEISSETSGIECISLNKLEDYEIFNLNGQPVKSDKVEDGIFIINGKKVFITK